MMEVISGKERKTQLRSTRRHASASDSLMLSTVLLLLLIAPLNAFLLRPSPSVVTRSSLVGSHLSTSYRDSSCRPPTVVASSPSNRRRQSALYALTREDKATDELKAAAIYKDALVKTAVSVGTALFFGLCVWLLKGQDSGLDYYAG